MVIIFFLYFVFFGFFLGDFLFFDALHKYYCLLFVV